MYFERVYGIWSPTKFKDALLAVVSSDRLYHPIKDYFATLHWDGQERIDTLLIDYFGAKDSPYTRAVIRKTLVAAVARIYKPGVKFDSILVLNYRRNGEIHLLCHPWKAVVLGFLIHFGYEG